MHMQSNRGASPPAYVGETVHERGAPQHEAEVVEATGTLVVVEYLSDGEPMECTAGEFEEIFA